MTRLVRLGLVALAVALAAPAAASAARYAVGVQDGIAIATLARRLGGVSGAHVENLAPLRALVIDVRDGSRLAAVPGVAWVERLRPHRRLAFVPSDPLVPRQWYLSADRAFDFWSVLPRPPSLPGVRVAVIDSGIDAGHPDFKGRIAAARSFVGASVDDTDGHGTFVAGVIAAALDDNVGIAGMAFPAQLLVAKVVGRDGTISPDSEARAIRWAIANGARVINMSIGGLRDPIDPARDTFSRLEATAVAYATAHGAVVVAAAGNADDAPSTPWPYASYPAALPHVLGVAALTRRGGVSSFSDRDPLFVDIAAPGEGILSTFPRTLTASRPSCQDQGYSSCGPREYRDAEGTSFAAPQVSAAVALVLSVRPSLTADQAATVVERTATDVTAGTGCSRCPLLRDAYTGWGALNIDSALRALAGPLPPADSHEPNDVPTGGYLVTNLPRTLTATIDYWDDPFDVYRVQLRAQQVVSAVLTGPNDMQTQLSLWSPGTLAIDPTALGNARNLIALESKPGTSQRLVATAPADGLYVLAVRAGTAGSGQYTLRVSRAGP